MNNAQMREIKFRFLSPFTGKIVYEHDGWAEGIGINEAIKSSCEDYDALPVKQ
jgi:hypothetical protein